MKYKTKYKCWPACKFAGFPAEACKHVSNDIFRTWAALAWRTFAQLSTWASAVVMELSITGRWSDDHAISKAEQRRNRTWCPTLKTQSEKIFWFSKIITCQTIKVPPFAFLLLFILFDAIPLFLKATPLFLSSFLILIPHVKDYNITRNIPLKSNPQCLIFFIHVVSQIYIIVYDFNVVLYIVSLYLVFSWLVCDVSKCIGTKSSRPFVCNDC
mgnify:CR=1 FL=1